MPDIEFNEESKIILEKLKERPINKKRLFYYTIISASMAVVFGLVVGFTFTSLSPILNDWIAPKDDVEEIVFPEDTEEMLPEEMVSVDAPTRDEWDYDQAALDNIPLDETQIRQIMSSFSLDLDDYRKLYASLAEYTQEMKHTMVTITCSYSNTDWLENIAQSEAVSAGVFVAETEEEYYILTEYYPLRNADKIQVALAYEEKYDMPGTFKAYDPITDMAVISVLKSDVPKIVKQREGIVLATIGSSKLKGMEGIPVIALGSPMGISDSVGYGMITSSTGEYSAQDSNYKLVQTDISGSSKGKGFLFNLQGELIGMITDRGSYEMKNLICAFGITDLKPRMEKLINGKKFASIGITGGNVPKSANEEFGVPYGAYVESVMTESPAMMAGMQQGDVITVMDGKKVSSFSDFTNILVKHTPGTTIEMLIMRRVQDEYHEMSIEVNLGDLE